MNRCYITATGSVSLKVLDISWNPIGDDGISVIIRGVMGNKVLVELHVQDCLMAVKGKLYHI